MRQALQSGVLLLLAAATAVAQKDSFKKGAAPPPPPKTGFKNGGGPRPPMNKAGLPKGAGAKMANPANQFERLIAMPPEQREQVIEKLPPQHQERLRARLEQFDKLPPQQKALRIELAKRYFALSTERQEAFQTQMHAFNQLEPRNRRMVATELQSLWALPENERQARLASEAFKARYSAEEQQILNTLSAANILPH
jgi:hypothetical protein